MSKKKILGLVGYPVSHSFSQFFFEEKFKNEGIEDYSYQLFPLPDLNELPQLLKNNPDIIGFNVTIPHKQAIYKIVKSGDETVKKLKAVNTVKISEGQLWGYNTDVFGFEKSLDNFLQKNTATVFSALILGSGGAAQAVKYVLAKKAIKYKIVSRQKRGTYVRYDDLCADDFRDALLIVNTTPLGMFPKTEDAPDIPYHLLSPRHLMFDLIYNPEKTVFLRRGEEMGCPIQNGWDMLRFQAEKSWEIWKN